MLSKKILEFIIDKLKEIEPKQIMLFGSYVYGNPSEHSDLDLLIIKDDVPSKIKIKKEIRKLISTVQLPKDIIVASTAEYEFYKTETGSIFKEINEKGLILWTS